MASDLETAIRNARRGIDDREAPIRGQLRDAYSRAVDALTVDIELITARIRNARAAGEVVNRDWLRRQERYRRLLSDAEREFARFTDEGLRIVRDGQVAAVSGGAAEAWELMEAAGIETGFGGRVNTGAVENLVSAFDPASPLRGVLDSYGEHGAKVIADVLTQGVIDGTGPREISRRIRRQLTDGYTKARLDALVRTELMRSYRASSNEQYARMSHLIQGYRWTAAHGVRTCLACLARSGKVQKEPWDQFHPQCRCLNTVVPIGSTFTPKTGEAWLREQGEDTQRAMFPSGESYDAWKSGDLKLSNFVGTRRSKVWGSSIYERSGRQALATHTPRPLIHASPPLSPTRSAKESLDYFNQNGVKITGAKNATPETLHIWAEGYRDLQARGYTVQDRLTFRKGTSVNMAEYAGPDRGIRVYVDSPMWRNPESVTRQLHDQGFFVATNPKGVVYHEVGHSLHEQQMGVSEFFYGRGIGRPRGELAEEIIGTVSRYGSTNNAEFVAEVFTMRMLDPAFRMSNQLEDLYRSLGGP